MLTKRVHWRDNDVQLLLRIWSRHIAELRLNKRNKHVYADMEAQMQLKNLKFSAEEIRTKIKNLTKRFRAEQKLAGCPSARWQFYEPIQNVLSQFPSLSRQHFRFNGGNGGGRDGGVGGTLVGDGESSITNNYRNYEAQHINDDDDDDEEEEDDDDEEDPDPDLYDGNNGLPLDVDIISDPEDDDLLLRSNQFNKPSMSSAILNSNRPLINNDNKTNTNISSIYMNRNYQAQQNRYSFFNDGISVIPLEGYRNNKPTGSSSTATITNAIAKKNTSPIITQTITNHTNSAASVSTTNTITTAASLTTTLNKNINNNNNNNAKNIPQKRKLSAVHEEILAEIRRANRLAEENQRETNRLLQQTNDIAERNLVIYRDFFEFIKTKI